MDEKEKKATEEGEKLKEKNLEESLKSLPGTPVQTVFRRDSADLIDESSEGASKPKQ